MYSMSIIKDELRKLNAKVDGLKVSIDSIVDYIGQVPKKTEPKKEVKK